MIYNYQSFFEAKNYQDLYHFTNIVSLIDIISDGYLESTKTLDDIYISDSLGEVVDYNNRLWMLKNKYNHFISTTRNKNMHNSYWTSDITSVRLKLDANKLTNKYKVVPVNYFYNKKDNDLSEQEEAILIRKGKDNIPLKPFLKELDIMSKSNSLEFLGNLRTDLTSRPDYTVSMYSFVYEELYGEELDYGVFNEIENIIESEDTEGLIEIYDLFLYYVKKWCSSDNIKLGYIKPEKIVPGGH